MSTWADGATVLTVAPRNKSVAGCDPAPVYFLHLSVRVFLGRIDALSLRRYDDQGKVASATTPAFADFRPLLEQLVIQ